MPIFRIVHAIVRTILNITLYNTSKVFERNGDTIIINFVHTIPNIESNLSVCCNNLTISLYGQATKVIRNNIIAVCFLGIKFHIIQSQVTIILEQ